MPPLGFWPQVPLLAQFQRIVELHESRRLLLELVRANQRPDHDYKELKANPLYFSVGGNHTAQQIAQGIGE